jgi:hypothetical protein
LAAAALAVVRVAVRLAGDLADEDVVRADVFRGAAFAVVRLAAAFLAAGLLGARLRAVARSGRWVSVMALLSRLRSDT